MVVLVPGFLEFVKMLDEILKELASSGELRPDPTPQALRSGLMGALEGLLRDQLLARSSRIASTYTEADIRTLLATFLSFCLSH
ncbi:MAG TPA: hypothetical protein VKE24_13985 [Candidatus Acidoferrales bacterium]|nr:hypothetical protein [Candidatus Acidoferrales bacterium]